MRHPALNYPSPAEIKIYINENWVDDAYRLDYTLSDSRTPLYDYTSTFFKGVAEGNTIIQGQLVINYRYPGYLYAAISQFMNPAILPEPMKTRSLDGSRGTQASSDLIKDLFQGSPSEKVSKLLGYKKLGALEHVRQITDEFYGSNSVVGDIPPSVSTTNKGLIPFNIRISYGGEEALYSKVIDSCYLVGESQVISASAIAGGDLSASGMPILEVYSFFGKRLVDEVHEKALKLNRLFKQRAITNSR